MVESTSWAESLFFLFSQQHKRHRKALSRASCPLIWGNHLQRWWEFTLALFAHHGGPTYDRILPSGLTSCSVIGLQEEGSSGGQDDRGPHTPRKPESSSQERVLLPFLLRGLKDNCKSFSFFIFEIANIFHFLQMQDRSVVPKSQPGLEPRAQLPVQEAKLLNFKPCSLTMKWGVKVSNVMGFINKKYVRYNQNILSEETIILRSSPQEGLQLSSPRTSVSLSVKWQCAHHPDETPGSNWYHP